MFFGKLRVIKAQRNTEAKVSNSLIDTLKNVMSKRPLYVRSGLFEMKKLLAKISSEGEKANYFSFF